MNLPDSAEDVSAFLMKPTANIIPAQSNVWFSINLLPVGA